MIRFNIQGQILDLPEGFSLQFTRRNILFAFDNVEVSRSTSFEIPATARNTKILDFANNPAYFGLFARARIAAQMQYSGGVENGYLYISSADKDKYTAVFVFGELLGLKAIKEAGKIAEIKQFEDTVQIGQHSIYDADEADIPLFANVAYQNKHAQTPTVSDHTGWDANYFPLPSIGLQSLIEECLTELGETLDATNVPELEGIRMTLAKPQADGTAQSNTFAVTLNVVNTAALNRVYFKKQSIFLVYNRQGGNSQVTWNAGGFKVSSGKVKIKFDALFPNTLFMVTTGNDPRGIIFLGDYSCAPDGTVTGNPLAGQEVELENGQTFLFVTAEMVSYSGGGNFGIAPPSGNYTYSGVTEVSFMNEEAQAGDVIYLQNNLPDYTLTDLLKMAAALTHSFLYYSPGVVSLVRDIDTSDPIELTEILSLEAIGRTFSDYAQNNLIKFADNPDVNPTDFGYTILNENIAEDKTLLEIPYSRPQIIPAFAQEANDYDALITDLIYNTGTHAHEYPNESGTLFYCGSNYYGEPIDLTQNDRLANLCENSTAVTVQAVLPLKDFASLDEKRIILVRGQLYVWTEATWQDGITTLHLNKITP